MSFTLSLYSYIRSLKQSQNKERKNMASPLQMAPAIFLLAAKDISEQNTPNNKFHDI